MENPYSRFDGFVDFLDFALRRLGEFENYFVKVGDTDVGIEVSKFARKEIRDLKSSFLKLPSSTAGRLLIYTDYLLKKRLRMSKLLLYSDKVLKKVLPNQKDKEVSDVMAFLFYSEQAATTVDLNMQIVAANYFALKTAEQEGTLEKYLSWRKRIGERNKTYLS